MVRTAHPMPQLSQQVSRSSEEISTLTFPLLWIHTRSEMASAAPNAWNHNNKDMKQGNRSSQNLKIKGFILVLRAELHSLPQWGFFLKFLMQFQITELLKSLATCGDIEQLLTQQDPQEPWSLISFRVGQLGHCCLASKSFGSFKSPAYWTLQRKTKRSFTYYCFSKVGLHN